VKGAPGEMKPTTDLILRLEKVTKTYRTKGGRFGQAGSRVVALNRISLDVRRGEIFGLVGESGSGKTTAGRLVVRLEEADAGEIFVAGTRVPELKGRRLKQFRRKVQMVFQDPYQSLNPQRSIFDTVSEPLVIHRMGNGAQRREAVAQALKSVGLSPPEDFFLRYPHQLSGGQRQRVAMARAMVLGPEFVVADEPTSMLDASISAQIFNILLHMRDKLGVTLLFITHSLAAARYLCDRIAVIYRGNLMEVGEAGEVIERPRHPYTQALLDALPRFGQCGAVRRYNTLLGAERPASQGVGCAFYSRCGVAQRLLCSTQAPSLRELAPGHRVACHYAEGPEAGTATTEACFYAT